MKILFIILSNDGGGGPQSTKDIVFSLATSSIEAETYIFRKNSGLLGFVKDLYLMYFFILNFFKNSKNDRLIFNSGGLLTGFFLAIFYVISFGKIFNLIQVFHNRVYRDDLNRLYNLLRFFLFEFNLFFSKSSVSVSEGVQKELKKQSIFNKNKIYKFIYNPIRDFSNIKHEKIYNFDSKVILGVGRLCKQKDFKTLIEAHSILCKNNFNYHLVIVGMGEDLVDLEEFSKGMHKPQNIHFWGYDDKIYNHYKNADVFVLSSIHEGFGLVLVEAMRSKIPVISTNCPYGPDEILCHGNFGQLVNVGNPYELSKKIMLILELNSIERDKIIDNAFNRSLDFSYEKVGLEYKHFLEELSLG